MGSGSRTKPRRLGLAKVKSGCTTCKARRVKCGEEKPSCHRCIKFGVTCSGYKPKSLSARHPAPVTRDLQHPRPILPRTKKPLYSIPNELVPMQFETQQEHSYFEIFCTKTAFDILPSAQSKVLRQILLQASSTSQSIRHAAAALGALDKTSSSLSSLSLLSLDSEKKQWADQHHRNALREYAQAIKHMRAAAASGNQDLRTTLLTCLVILCFEAWNGNHELAVKQIQTGFKLIQAWKECSSDSGPLGLSPPTRNPIEDDLVLVFSRLDVQVVSFAEDRVSESAIFAATQETKLLDRLPTTFESLDEAEIYENTLLRRVMRFLATEVSLPKPVQPVHAIPVNAWWGEKSRAVVASQQRTNGYFERWFAAFDHVWDEIGYQMFAKDPTCGHQEWSRWRARMQEKSISQCLSEPQKLDRIFISANQNPDFERAAMFRVHMYAAWTALQAVCLEDETAFDAYNHIFAETVELSECLLKGQTLINGDRSPKFSFDSYVVIPLHMTGHKCRDPTIRRKAISLLLNYPRREGVWDSIPAGRMIEWAMQVEEEHLQDGHVPGWARIHGVMFERDMEKRTALLRCEQRISALSKEVTTRRKIIAW